MAAQHVHVLNTITEVESITDRWNDLWRRSDVTPPTPRVELLRNWLDHFAPHRKFQAVVIEECDQLVAAMPLVAQRWGKMIPAGGLPKNEWSGAGDLLVDPQADVGGALRLIASTLHKLSWPIYRFSQVRCESPRWRQFIELLDETGLCAESRPNFEVKFVDVPNHWDSYRQSWSKDHRQRVSRMFRRLREQGAVRFRHCIPKDRVEAEPLLLRAFCVEDRGWKGRAGTSLLRTRGIADYVLRMSELLTPQRELEIALLELNGEVISCQILWNSKGILHGYKGSYDERFQRFGPGHLLIHEILRDACETQRVRGYDCLGPNNPALNLWRGSTYLTGQFTVARQQWLGRALLFAYQRCRPPTVRTADVNESVST